jgi:N-acetylglucosamine-6-phosphate deacetylase
VSHGPVLTLPGGQLSGTWNTTLRVDSLAEADTLAAEDPLLLSGFVDVEVSGGYGRQPPSVSQ